MSASDTQTRPNSTIARQHAQIESLVDALTSRFDGEKRATRNLVSLLNSLAAHLEMHFELEEEDEYFGYILTHAPHLSERVDRLLHQHEMLKTNVDDLVDLARQAFEQNSGTAELASKFAKFRSLLLEHEKKEIDLLQEAFNRDLGAGD